MKLQKLLLPVPLFAAFAAREAHAAIASTAAVATHGGLDSDRIFIIALGAILIVGAWFGRCTSSRS